MTSPNTSAQARDAIADLSHAEDSSPSIPGKDRSREAILYVGPLDLGLTTSKSVNGVVTRLRGACEMQSRTGSSQWRVEWRSGALAPLGDASGPKSHHVATVLRRDGDEETTEFDVFEYAWSAHFAESWQTQNVVARALRALGALFQVGAFLRFFNKAPRRAEKGRLQLVLAVVAILVVALYFGFVVWAAIETFLQLAELPLPLVGDGTALITFPQWMTIAMTALGAAGFTKLRNGLSTVGAGLLSANAYLRTADRRGVLMHGLLEQAERFRDDDRYRSVTVISYSFGSVLAIDALFPKEHPPERAFEKFKKLVTIGSAYDFVRAAAPKYLENRHASAGVPEKWINVYAPIDLLGSSFTKDAKSPGEADIVVARVGAENTKTKTKDVMPHENISYDNGVRVSLANALEFYGFTSHAAYWGVDDKPDRNVFALVVDKLYPEPGGHLR